MSFSRPAKHTRRDALKHWTQTHPHETQTPAHPHETPSPTHPGCGREWNKAEAGTYSSWRWRARWMPPTRRASGGGWRPPRTPAAPAPPPHSPSCTPSQWSAATQRLSTAGRLLNPTLRTPRQHKAWLTAHRDPLQPRRERGQRRVAGSSRRGRRYTECGSGEAGGPGCRPGRGCQQPPFSVAGSSSQHLLPPAPRDDSPPTRSLNHKGYIYCHTGAGTWLTPFLRGGMLRVCAAAGMN